MMRDGEAHFGPRKRARQQARVREAARTVLVWALCASMGAGPVAAQITAAPNANIPYGSPVAGADGGSSSREDSGANAAADAAAYPSLDRQIEAVNIDPDRRSADDGDALPVDRQRQLVTGRTVNPRIKPILPSEFEKYVELSLGRPVPRFGANLLLPGNGDYALPATSTIPPDYVLNVGDVISIALTGSIEGTADVEIDTDGKIFLPRVGSIMLGGVPYRDLQETVSEAIGRQYRGYTVTASVKKLRGLRVYVTGFANNPGAYSVNSLSTMVNALLAAGGPSSGGSSRSAQLYRNGRLVSDFDLYDLILRGDRSRDAVLQNEDVLYIPPLGEQLAVTGSVNNEAVYEAKAGEPLEAILAFAGGPAVLADRSRVILYRSAEKDGLRGQDVARSEAATLVAKGGDILQILSQGTLQQPLERQSVMVRIEGEVSRPGNYFVAPGTDLQTVLAQAGGLTSRAFPFGTRFERQSVRQQQRASFLEAVDQLEVSLAAAPLTTDQLNAADAATQQAAARATLDRLRKTEPDGRMVMDVAPGAAALAANFPLENNDRIMVPSRPSTVGVFGAVYRPASFLLEGTAPRRVADYVQMAGGPLRAADKGNIFVVRANGAVLTKKRGAMSATVVPGDVIFMPVRTQSSSIWAKIRDISTVIFQLGIGAAAFVAVAK